MRGAEKTNRNARAEHLTRNQHRMGAPIGAVVFFAWVLVVQLIGLGVFTKGFFLTRVELGLKSQCDIHTLLTPEEFDHLSDAARRGQGRPTFNKEITDSNDESVGCWLPPRFKRVVWVVVDALRFDFAAYSPPEDQAENGPHHSPGAKHYLNHLPVIHEAINGGKRIGHATLDTNVTSVFEGTGGVLFQFEADPPTVTMQRLKGLTTGGLPTFIDFRDNFHSPEIAEDNWVDQVKARAVRRRDRNVPPAAGGADNGEDKEGELVFMGDDTWTSLYPTYFSRSFPFPSFNTRDLHTVDDGVLDHLSAELEKKDWDVLVAHFLGVDHVGHTFGPASQAMEQKLDQMDAALRTVFSSVDDETVVFVLGDHGMTEDGNHGGATPEETGAALLIWSRSGERLLGSAEPFEEMENSEKQRNPITWDGKGKAEEHGGHPRTGSGTSGTVPSPRKVAQIDLVPTVSLLLGTPIPFGSLGGIIPEVFLGRYSFEAVSEEGGNARGGAEHEMDTRYLERLCDALLVNCMQVWRYLSKYAEVASMPKGDMFYLESLLLAARDAHTELRRKRRSRSPTSRDVVGGVKGPTVWQIICEVTLPLKVLSRLPSASGDASLILSYDSHSESPSRTRNTAPRLVDVREVCASYRQFLDYAIGLGRSLWTQYDTGLMCWGLFVLFLATVVLLVRVTIGETSARADAGVRGWGKTFDSDRCKSGVPTGWQASRERAPRWGVERYGVSSGVAGLVGAIVGDAVFDASGTHVYLAKVASCSCIGVCCYYIQAFVARRSRSVAVHARSRSVEGRESRTLNDSFSGCGGSVADGLASNSSPISANVIMPGFLAVLYCAGLFSNSFIEAEDGLHRFLGASTLLVLAALLAVSAASAPSTSASRTAAERTLPRPGMSQRDSHKHRAHLGRFALVSRFVPGRETNRAACFVLMAAVCLRLAASVQDSNAGGVGLSPGAGAFGVVRSILPLSAIWYLCRSAYRNGRSCSTNLGCAEANVFKSGEQGGIGQMSTSGIGVSAERRRSKQLFVVHSVLQALSLAAIALYWIDESVTASTEAIEVSSSMGTESNTSSGLMPSILGRMPLSWIPARLLLPRVTYALCVVGLGVTLSQPSAKTCFRSRFSSNESPLPSSEEASATKPSSAASTSNTRGDDTTCEGDFEQAYAGVSAEASAKIITHLVPVVVLLLGPGSPPVVLLMAVVCGFVVRGVSLAAGNGILVPVGAVAVVWSVVGRAFFFLTGHHNQFSRLQYSAAFVGFDEFDFRIGGLLLFLNTFGTEILAAFTIPLIAAAAASADTTSMHASVQHSPQQGPESGSSAAPIAALSQARSGRESERARSRTRPGVGGRVENTNVNLTHDFGSQPVETSKKDYTTEGGTRVREEGSRVVSGAAFLEVMERLSGLTLLLSAARTFLSAANVSVQRGHLMLWAVFAPKFVFDATMQAVSGMAAVVAWAVVVGLIRACDDSGSGDSVDVRSARGDGVATHHKKRP